MTMLGRAPDLFFVSLDNTSTEPPLVLCRIYVLFIASRFAIIGDASPIRRTSFHMIRPCTRSTAHICTQGSIS